jgi:hypothetical protein
MEMGETGPAYFVDFFNSASMKTEAGGLAERRITPAPEGAQRKE